MERHAMTVMCVISRALYNTRHCRCDFSFISFMKRHRQLDPPFTSSV